MRDRRCPTLIFWGGRKPRQARNHGKFNFRALRGTDVFGRLGASTSRPERNGKGSLHSLAWGGSYQISSNASSCSHDFPICGQPTLPPTISHSHLQKAILLHAQHPWTPQATAMANNQQGLVERCCSGSTRTASGTKYSHAPAGRRKATTST